MNIECFDCREYIADYFIDKQLSTVKKLCVRKHIQKCEKCRDAYIEFRENVRGDNK